MGRGSYQAEKLVRLRIANKPAPKNKPFALVVVRGSVKMSYSNFIFFFSQYKVLVFKL